MTDDKYNGVTGTLLSENIGSIYLTRDPKGTCIIIKGNPLPDVVTSSSPLSACYLFDMPNDRAILIRSVGAISGISNEWSISALILSTIGLWMDRCDWPPAVINILNRAI
jgi:hypothetical protein